MPVNNTQVVCIYLSRPAQLSAFVTWLPLPRTITERILTEHLLVSSLRPRTAARWAASCRALPWQPHSKQGRCALAMPSCHGIQVGHRHIQPGGLPMNGKYHLPSMHRCRRAVAGGANQGSDAPARCTRLQPFSWLWLHSGLRVDTSHAVTKRCQFGLRRTIITESPLKKSLLMKRSLLTGCEAFPPLPVFGICVQR